MTFERFKELWNEHFIKPLIKNGLIKKESDLKSSHTSPQWEAACEAASRGDMSLFDENRRKMNEAKQLQKFYNKLESETIDVPVDVQKVLNDKFWELI